MTADEYKALNAKQMSEKVFQQQVINYANARGWMVYHTHNSRRSQPGFPDLVMVRVRPKTLVGRLLFAELKTEKGKPTHPQKIWLDWLRCVPGIEVYLWRPSDMDAILDTLR